MLLSPAPLARAIDAAQAAMSPEKAPEMATEMSPEISPEMAAKNPAPVVYLSPQGATLTQPMLAELAALPALILLAGRYEGIDERIVESRVSREISIGDYVLSGGELAAMVVLEGIARLLPGVLGNAQSAAQDSFAVGGATDAVGDTTDTGGNGYTDADDRTETDGNLDDRRLTAPTPTTPVMPVPTLAGNGNGNHNRTENPTITTTTNLPTGLLDWPHYTRPEVFEGRAVPPVLLGGDHAAIRRWRLMQSLGRTAKRRPDLLAGRELGADARELLRAYRQTHNRSHGDEQPD